MGPVSCPVGRFADRCRQGWLVQQTDSFPPDSGLVRPDQLSALSLALAASFHGPYRIAGRTALVVADRGISGQCSSGLADDETDRESASLRQIRHIKTVCLFAVMLCLGLTGFVIFKKDGFRSTLPYMARTLENVLEKRGKTNPAFYNGCHQDSYD